MTGPIVVTGVAGLLGGAVATLLTSEGSRVLGLDRRRPQRTAGFPFEIDDLSDAGVLTRRFEGAAAVIHCAAIARLGDAPEAEIFSNNTATTMNVVLAAEAAGVKRLVYASSQSALGLAYAPRVVTPDYLPVDEAHPARPLEAYGLSKLVGEGICEMAARRGRLACLALRFPVIWHEAAFAECTGRRLGNETQAAKSQWAYVDLRDAARACAIAIRAQVGAPFRVFNIGAPWPFNMPDPAAALARYYDDKVAIRTGWKPGDAVFSAERAQIDLGFLAEWEWRVDKIVRHATIGRQGSVALLGRDSVGDPPA